MIKNITYFRGRTLSFGFVIDGLTADLSTAFFSVKKNVEDEEYVLQKTLGDGIEKFDDKTYKVRVAPEDTENVDPGCYVYDLTIGVGNDVYTLMAGVLKLTATATRGVIVSV